MGTLAKRTGAGLLFAAVMIGCLLVPWGLLAWACILSVALSFEFYRMTVDRRFRKEMLCITAGSVVILTLLFFHFRNGLDIRYVAWGFVPVVAASVFLLFDAAENHDFPAAVYFPLLYILLPLASALWLAWSGGAFSWRLLLGVIVVSWFNDIGAYVVGMSFGQRPGSRKLFPALSPKKSWVGVAGGTLSSFLAAWAVSATFGDPVLPLRHWLAIAGIVSVFGVLGDLFESLIKRHAQVKDAGHLIPGHGGLLDRFDGTLFVLPLTAVYLLLFSLL